MMRTSNELGIAVIGYGYWGVNYVRVFSELPDARVIAVCDKVEQRLAEAKKRYPQLIVATELEEILDNPEVDAIVVCTEATSHFAAAGRCLRAGKHILVEKPITTNVEDAVELDWYASAHCLTMMVGHTFIYNAAVQKMKQCINEGTGRIHYMHSRRTNLGPIRRDVNALWDLATHDIAIFNHLIGNAPEWVSAVASKVLRNGREDVGFICLGYPDNILANIHVSWADPNKAREVIVVCSDKRVVFDDLSGTEQVRIFEKGIAPIIDELTTYGEYRLHVRDGDIVSPKIETSEPLKNQCRHFLECISARATPLTSGREGADVVRVLCAMDTSVRQGGMRVEVEHYGQRAHAALASSFN